MLLILFKFASNTMAQNTYKKNTPKESVKQSKEVESTPQPDKQQEGILRDRRFQLTVGLIMIVFAVIMTFASLSYIFTGKEDQSVVESLFKTGIISSGLEVQNILGIIGAVLAHYFIYKWFGVAFFLFIPLVFSLGFSIVFGKHLLPVKSSLTFILFFTFWLSLTLGYLVLSTGQEKTLGFLSGGFGYELSLIFHGVLGWGTFLFLILSLLIFVIYFFDIKDFGFGSQHNKAFEPLEVVESHDEVARIEDEIEEKLTDEDLLGIKVKTILKSDEIVNDEASKDLESQWNIKSDLTKDKIKTKEPVFDLGLTMEESNLEIIDNQPIEVVTPSTLINNPLDIKLKSKDDDRIAAALDDLGDYDPTLELSNYIYPPLDLLNEPPPNKVQVTREELEANKDKIVETLSHYSIGITKISATIGPTVTLYEIVPDPGVRIAKIKNLEDDIALSLSALGIRIIAPMPGKGTIGIEVPNKNKEMVSIKSVLASEAFQKTDKILPIALGKTISNDVFIGDLAAMPHLLMAGATGQGKSVGLNALIASLIYKMHPAQLKFVMVDPKKVELSLFNKLERHFMAKLPNNDEAIITDTKKVIYTLNSLCIEMDNRYDLLKKAGCRNLREYNAKFVDRKLLPTEGHKFLPYIVLIIDELADLMMTAGKEVETPIARLAQLARAIGIHLVVATQRPSVNVITGIIKANFPARLSFKVTSKIDSRTILDAGGADQLIGKGDMLLSQGSDMIRIQCAFVDTPEVEKICDFIGEQRGYPSAYYLPEYLGDEADSGGDSFNFSDRDPMFEEAARLIVTHQQGSTSLIQRKLSLGYNRAGRLIDQLEAAGIVGPFEGSKAREVYIKDEMSLEDLLKNFNK